MSKQRTEPNFLDFINPFFWIREIFSYLITLFLLINRFFGLIFGSLVVVFVAMFFYDRYCDYTFKDASDIPNDALTVSLFTRNKEYKSPFSDSVQLNSTKIVWVRTEQQQQPLEPKRPKTSRRIRIRNEETVAYSRPYSSIQNEVRHRTSPRRR